jgi:hypothetical protein
MAEIGIPNRRHEGPGMGAFRRFSSSRKGTHFDNILLASRSPRKWRLELPSLLAETVSASAEVGADPPRVETTAPANDASNFSG